MRMALRFDISVLVTLIVLAATPVTAAQDGARNDSLTVTQPEAYVVSGDGQTVQAGALITDGTPIEYRDITVDGVVTSVRTRRVTPHSEAYLLQAEPIAEILHGRFERKGTILSYFRMQDGAVMTLDFADGKVRSNGVVLGKLPNFEPAEQASLWLDPNAVAVLTGTVLSHAADGELVFVLDQRLRSRFDFDLWVNGRPIDARGSEARTIGPVLLVPLRPVAAALGHEVRSESGFVTIVRAQDSAVIRLDLASGLISINGTPRGVAANMSFADRDQLLLPFSAIETLTGTHITVQSGSNRINVQLGDRLDGAALPGEMVASEIGNTPFTPEALSYQLSDRGPVRAEFSSRVARFNSRLTYESAGGLQRSKELQPRWLSLDVQSLDGWVGSVGDYSDRFRELSGVDVSRIRGLSYREQTDDGSIVAVAAGVTLTGSERLSETASKPEFADFAAGVRLMQLDGAQELGVSMKTSDDGNTSAFVLSGQKVFDTGDQEGPLQSVYLSADAGHFDTSIGSGLDVRARVETRYKLTDQINAAITAYRDGEKFAAAASESAFEGVFDNRIGARTGGYASTDWRSADSWGVLQYVAVGARVSYNHVSGSNEITTRSLAASVSTRIGREGPDLSIDVDQTRAETAGAGSDAVSVRARAFQRFDWGNGQASFTSQEGEAGTTQQAVVTVQTNPLRKSFGDGAFASVAPSTTLAWIDGRASLRAGASAAFSTGAKLGDRVTVDGQFAALTSVKPDDNATRYFANLQARYLINAKTEFVATYFDDLQGQNDLSVAIRGTITFNEPRKHTIPLEDRGVLTGRVFVDLNRDGVRQENEPGLPGARVSVKGTRLSFAADRDGNFTIQNMKEGLFGLSISRQSLPLGCMVAEGQMSKATISSGRRTNVEIPVIMSGQLRGAVFIDMDGDGKASPGDQRLEGQTIQLIETQTSNTTEAASASFGQYAFENLAAGEYKLRVMIGWQEFVVTAVLTDDNLLQVVPIAIPPDLVGADTTPASEPTVEAAEAA